MRWLSGAVPLVALLILGVVRLALRSRALRENRRLAESFLARLSEYYQSRGGDNEAYTWLLLRSEKMQSQLGTRGVAEGYKPPFANYIIRNYPIVLNALPELRKSLQGDRQSRQAHEYAAIIQETLLRHIGLLDDHMDRIRRELMNPVIWLTEGVKFLLILPVMILNWIGLVSSTIVARVADSAAIRILSGLAALVGFAGAVIGMVTDWQPFMAIVKSFLGR